MQIAKKVKTQQYNFWHISRTQTGPKLHHMRQLYTAKVLPIFSYACGAWYLPRDVCASYKMNSAYIEKLEYLHKSFLLDVSGGITGAIDEVLFKELHIHRMSTFLEKTAIVQRARELETPQHKELCRIRAQAWSKKRVSPTQSHPYHQLDAVAREILDDALKSGPGNEPVNLRKRVKQLADRRAEEASRAAWEDHKLTYIAQRAGRIPAAYSDPGGWGRHNLMRYANLPRHQSSMLFQCRAEVTAVNATLYIKRAHKNNPDRSKDTPCCPCGHPKQTVEHLFSYCPDLEEARARELVLRVGTKHVDELLQNHPAEASAFAVLHFGICKDSNAELFLPRRGAGQGEEERKGGRTKAAKRRGQQQQGRRRERPGTRGKCEMSKTQRRAHKARARWKARRRREAVEG